MNGYRDHVLEHYREEAATHGLEASSTMADLTTRDIEVEAICALVEQKAALGAKRLLEIGCGNGYLLAVLRQRFPNLEITGLDFSEDMVRLAKQRNVPDTRAVQGDVMEMEFDDASFDLVVGERCIINLMERAHQERAVAEVARVTAAGGHFVSIEAFLSGLRNLNEAREELGLEPNREAHHNLWFEPDWFTDVVSPTFDFEKMSGTDRRGRLLVPNFLSSYYFFSRVLYPAVSRAPVRYNTQFVKFFADERPRGDFSPIRLHLLRRKSL